MIHEKFDEYIPSGLEHPHPEVKCMVLEQFTRCVLAEGQYNTEYSGHIWRIYQILDNTITHTDAYMAQFLIDQGFIDTFFADLKSTDFLAAMAALDLVPSFGESLTIFKYMEEQGVLDEISKLMNPASEHPSFVKASAFKTFSRFSEYSGSAFVDLCKSYPYMDYLEKYLDQSGDTTLKINALVCMGISGSDPAVLKLLCEDKKAVDKLIELCTYSAGDVKLESLRTLSCLFEKSEPQGETSDANFNIYMQIDNGGLLSSLVKNCKQGIPELTIACLSVLKNICLYRWGQREVSLSSSVFEYLLAKNQSEDYNVRKWKHTIVSSIVHHQDFSVNYDDDACSRLRQFITSPNGDNTAAQVASISA
ncbi:26S proteasome non-ATPase regulatory subunit 5 [Zancudomyces culisetae]|nr:26S proteasome non-ATPase regulatory subunit 5 [Zancudomyces culisetae]|eukprot:OMH78469.1 26S proteasome non-ATPase regulatory subunit 5 [Zancudomyces culisetae]